MLSPEHSPSHYSLNILIDVKIHFKGNVFPFKLLFFFTSLSLYYPLSQMTSGRMMQPAGRNFHSCVPESCNIDRLGENSCSNVTPLVSLSSCFVYF